MFNRSRKMLARFNSRFFFQQLIQKPIKCIDSNSIVEKITKDFEHDKREKICQQGILAFFQTATKEKLITFGAEKYAIAWVNDSYCTYRAFLLEQVFKERYKNKSYGLVVVAGRESMEIKMLLPGGESALAAHHSAFMLPVDEDNQTSVHVFDPMFDNSGPIPLQQWLQKIVPNGNGGYYAINGKIPPTDADAQVFMHTEFSQYLNLRNNTSAGVMAMLAGSARMEEENRFNSLPIDLTGPRCCF